MTETPVAAQPGPNPVDVAYRDRAHVLALAALHYPAYIAYSDKEHPEWPVLTLETPHGQMTWHIAPSELELFPHVRHEPDAAAAAKAYDGHTTDEKQARIRARVASYPAMV